MELNSPTKRQSKRKGGSWAAGAGRGEGRGGLGWEEGPRDFCWLHLPNPNHVCLILHYKNIYKGRTCLLLAQFPKSLRSPRYFTVLVGFILPQNNLLDWDQFCFAVIVLLRKPLLLTSICF